jgi:hypothetical protein
MALSSAVAQDNPSNVRSVPLVLVRIAVPDVQGRFDHMEIDLKTVRVSAAKLTFAREEFPNQPVQAVVGGLHLFP